MILQSLVRYYEALEEKGEITRPGWCTAKAAFALELSGDGRLIRVLPIKIEVPRGKKTVWEAQKLTVPEMATRASNVCANFLCDNSSYLLGIDRKGKPERTKECFQCAKEKHLDVLKNTESPVAAAVKRYFEIWDPETAEEDPVLSEDLEEILGGANLIFMVDGQYAHEDGAIREAWESYARSASDGPEGICLVTGKRTQIARTHGALRGVPGAQPSGAALISFNASAFESYGKEQSYNAPVGKYAVYAYTTALSYLLADRRHTTLIGDTTVVYWSEDGADVCRDVFASVMEPTQDNCEIVDSVFKKLAAGKAVGASGVLEDLSTEQRFYILGLAPNAARISVRFFYQDSFGNILRHIKEHYDRMEIARPAKDTAQFLGIWRMLQETVNKKSKDKKPAANIAGAVYRAVLSGERYPDSLYQAVLLRIRAEQDDKEKGGYKITRGRAAIIKAYLLRNTNYDKEEFTMALNEDCKITAYTLGREFAVLEKIQKEANDNKDVNTTIKDRYFNGACAAPASIFPILFKLKNSHLKKLSNKKREIYFENLLTQLQGEMIHSQAAEGSVPEYPKRLSLEEQGVFILGYYHQTEKFYEKKSEEES